MEITDVDFNPLPTPYVSGVLELVQMQVTSAHKQIACLEATNKDLTRKLDYWQKRAAYYQEQRNQAYWSERSR